MLATSAFVPYAYSILQISPAYVHIHGFVVPNIHFGNVILRLNVIGEARFP